MKGFPWLASVLLILAFLVFGEYLGTQSSQLLWLLAATHAITEAALLTIAWKPLRNLFLLGFQSDVGNSIMAILGALVAVAVFAWIYIFAYFLLMLAASLLVRIELVTRGVHKGLAFLLMSALSLLGLALGWGLVLLTDWLAAWLTFGAPA
jgi:hypothetical protein